MLLVIIVFLEHLNVMLFISIVNGKVSIPRLFVISVGVDVEVMLKEIIELNKKQIQTHDLLQSFFAAGKHLGK